MEAISGFGFFAWSRRSAEQALGAEVFVNVGPMDCVTSPSHFPIVPLLGSGVEKFWIPGERNTDFAAVAQRHTESILCKTYVGDAFARLKGGNAHSMPPGVPADAPLQWIVPDELQWC
jgi:hypothetical protein